MSNRRNKIAFHKLAIESEITRGTALKHDVHRLRDSRTWKKVKCIDIF